MVERLGRTAQKRKWALEGIENACRARGVWRSGTSDPQKEEDLTRLWEHVSGTKDEKDLITMILERVAFGLGRERNSVIKEN